MKSNVSGAIIPLGPLVVVSTLTLKLVRVVIAVIVGTENLILFDEIS